MKIWPLSVWEEARAHRALTQFLRMPPPREALPCPPKWSPLWWAIQRRKEKKRRLAPSLGARVLPARSRMPPGMPQTRAEWAVRSAMAMAQHYRKD